MESRAISSVSKNLIFIYDLMESSHTKCYYFSIVCWSTVRNLTRRRAAFKRPAVVLDFGQVASMRQKSSKYLCFLSTPNINIQLFMTRRVLHFPLVRLIISSYSQLSVSVDFHFQCFRKKKKERSNSSISPTLWNFVGLSISKFSFKD